MDWTQHQQNVPDCSLYHGRHTQKLSWDPIHPFYRNVANRHAVVPWWENVKQSSREWNGLAHFSCVFSFVLWHIPKFYENPFTHFSMILLTNTDPVNRKINPGFKGLTTTSLLMRPFRFGYGQVISSHTLLSYNHMPCNCLSILGWKFQNVHKRGPWEVLGNWFM